MVYTNTKVTPSGKVKFAGHLHADARLRRYAGRIVRVALAGPIGLCAVYSSNGKFICIAENTRLFNQYLKPD